jgi:hypothetical protein
MTGTSNWPFGLLVAYVLPGFIGLAGLAPLVPSVAGWLQPSSVGGLGAPVYAVLAATAVGMILSCFRWLTVDQIHHWMGLTRPAWDNSQLKDALGAFDYLVQNHYRYYEFCGNTLIAVICAYGVNRIIGRLPLANGVTDAAIVIVSIVLFLASRDALSKYYTRTAGLLGQIANNEKGD